MPRILSLSLTLAAVFTVVPAVGAYPAIFPLKLVRAGMTGTGKTVFSGSRVEEFKVEILGVLDNVGPKQSLILARLSGGPLEHTGVMQGMSGSPVYLEGRLAGAVAMAFPFAKDPIAGIRPIEDMLSLSPGVAPASGVSVRRRASGVVTPWDTDLSRVREAERGSIRMAGDSRLVDIATPISFGGFTNGTIEEFSGQLRALGLEPRQAVSGGGSPPEGKKAVKPLEPGSMISVQLITGDYTVGADGTLTCIDGRTIHAFGHRFLALGDTDLPFSRAEVITLLPNLSSSFKISIARERRGAITQDRTTAVTGELGQTAAMVPVSIRVKRKGLAAHYRMQVVDDRYLAPLLLQMAVFSAIDATERGAGRTSLSIGSELQFVNNIAPVRMRNTYAGDASVSQVAALSVASPLSYALNAGFDAVKLKSVTVNIESEEARRQARIEQVWSSAKTVKPGDAFEIHTVLAGENGTETTSKVEYQVPVGAPQGTLFVTVADANVTNLIEFRQMLADPPKTPASMIRFLNQLRPNTNAYVRIWRADAVYQVQGEDLPAPPPSLAMILARSQGGLAGAAVSRNAKVAEIVIPAGDVAVSGSKTIQVEVKQ
ncbi:MAG: hypothetical protein IT160_16640 [Bryobacterales bacterium]|nr:hypothetical protein [Bryobacterales bacterium]